jgi:hypothetical protein
MPARICRELTAAEKLSLRPTADYVKANAKGRIWVVARYTDPLDKAGAKDNAAGTQYQLVSDGVPVGRIRITYLEQAGVKKKITAIEVTVIDT